MSDVLFNIAAQIVDDDYFSENYDRSKPIKVKSATITLGVIPGYITTGVNKDSNKESEKLHYSQNLYVDEMENALSSIKQNERTSKNVETAVLNLIEKYYNMVGVPLSFTITPSKVCYRREWSHRDDGEPVYILEAIQNKNFKEQRNTKLWMKVVECIAGDLKKQFKQSTVTIQYSDREIIYLKEKEIQSGDLQN